MTCNIKPEPRKEGLPPWKIDIPVALNFFVRPEIFSQCFESVRATRPSRLFLISDGPRPDHPSDTSQVAECRRIASGVDWDCEVYHIYNEVNRGLFDTYFSSMAQVFEIVDRCIFLEDDLVPNESFFWFCREMLERYENDLRVSFVSGVNYLGEYDKPTASYFFAGESSIYGYAMWKRTFESMTLDFLGDPYAVNCICDCARQIKPGYEKRIKRTKADPMWEGHQPHVEFYKNVLRLSQNQIFIVPSKNLVSNIGLSGDSTHSANSLNKLPKATQGIFFQETYNLAFPLVHPQYVVRDRYYEEYANRLLAWNRPVLLWTRRVEALARHLRYGDFERVRQKFKTLLMGDLSKS